MSEDQSHLETTEEAMGRMKRYDQREALRKGEARIINNADRIILLARIQTMRLRKETSEGYVKDLQDTLVTVYNFLKQEDTP